MSDQPRSARTPNYLYLTPLFLALLPLVRVAFKNQPVIRDRVFFSVIGLGIVHGATLMSTSVPKQQA